MKKILFIACGALLAASSCTSEVNEEGFIDKANTISFNAYPNKSRAVSGDVTSDNMKNDNFGVVGYSGNDIYLYKKETIESNIVYKAVEQKWVSSGESGSWEYADLSDLRFWPKDKMDFYAYFPFSDEATFTASNANDASGNPVNVMTIPNVNCSHDVIFAHKGEQEKITRVPLTFHHAFAKMMTLTISMPNDGMLYKSDCNVEVQKVEFINTSTKGSINVDNLGKATYTVGSSDETLNKTLASSVTVNKTNTTETLVNNGTNAQGYFFATNSNEVNNVTGTGKAMWDGVKASIATSSVSTPTTLSASELVCLKLTCKVWNVSNDNKYYYVGSDGSEDSNYGEIYIPLKGTDGNSNAITTFDAGKRYNYTIEMKNNVGYDDNGDPILTPILFKVQSVVGWEDVDVIITL